MVSEAGTSELRTQNEDRWSLVEDVSPGLVLLAVYDGHGGNDAAHFLQQVRRPFPVDDAAGSDRVTPLARRATSPNLFSW